VKEPALNQTENSRNLAPDQLEPKINKINFTSGNLIPPSIVPPTQNNMRVSFLIKKKK
jgi:hypothetical protein